MDATTLNQAVNAKYSSLAQASLSGDRQGEVQVAHDATAASFGYDTADLQTLPNGTNLGLSCGAPLGPAQLQPGETVLDLGSGGGLDCLLAVKAVGKEGNVIGIDRSKEMLQLARRNAKRMGVDGFVQFLEGEITNIPLKDGTVDVIISNCVLNLVPHDDKPNVFTEMFRVLKAGGRVAVSDVLAKRVMPDEIRRDVALVVGCVAGASLVENYRDWMNAVGFANVKLAERGKDLNVFKGECCLEVEAVSKKSVEPSCCASTSACCTPCYKKEDTTVPVVEDMDFNDWVGSYEISAIKPH